VTSPSQTATVEVAVGANSTSSTSSVVVAPTSPTTPLAGGLQCRIGRARVAVPIEFVARVIEYSVVPLPLGRSWIGGLGLYEGTPLLSIALVGAEARRAATATTKGIFLHAPGAPIAWALEIHEVFAFVRASVQPRRADSAGDKLPHWITAATTEDGQSIGWIRVGDMLTDLQERVGAVKP
jgi:hypothetical protein